MSGTNQTALKDSTARSAYRKNLARVEKDFFGAVTNEERESTVQLILILQTFASITLRARRGQYHPR
jgi:hypothetical protein